MRFSTKCGASASARSRYTDNDRPFVRNHRSRGLGLWPAESASMPVPERASQDLVDRLTSYMTKAAREAKVHTSWLHINEEYGAAVEHFISRTLTGPAAQRFMNSFVPFQRRVAHAAMVNALAQLVLKLTSPGVPDFYQGTEFWDFSLVDPDNRRPVDFAARQIALDGLMPLLAQLETGAETPREVSELFDNWVDARIKLLITMCGLRFRRDHADLLLKGGYQPLEASGASANNLIAFARYDDSGTLVTIVPRLIMSLTGGNLSLPLGPETWGTTQIILPPSCRAERYRHLVTGETLQPSESHLPAAAVFRTSPVAVMWTE